MLYFDGTGEAVIIDDSALSHGSVTELGRVDTGGPHHGFAVSHDGNYVITLPGEDVVALPNEMAVASPTGEIGPVHPCAQIHGEAGLAYGGAAACADGVLVLSDEGSEWTSRFISYPSVDDEDPYGYGHARAWLLLAPPQVDWMAAAMGARHVLVVDPVSETARAFDMGESVALLALGVTSTGDGMVVLTADGVLHLVDPIDGEVVSSTELLSPYAEGEPGTPYRQLVMVDDVHYVSDPVERVVVEVLVGDQLERGRTFELDITPGFIEIFNR